jgi:hypothetical protein
MISEEAEKETFSCSQRVLETNRKRDFISSSPLFLRVCQKEIQNIYSKEAEEAEKQTWTGLMCFISRQTEIQKCPPRRQKKRHLLVSCAFGNGQKKRHKHAVDAFFYVDDACVLLLALGEHPPRVAEPELVVKRASNQTTLVKEGRALKVSLTFLEIEIPMPVIELDDIKLRYMEVRASLAD